MPNICVIQINVVNMDQAIDFYSNKLGFQVKSRDHYPYVVVLEHEPNTFILSKVDKPAQIDYPNVAQTLINFQTDNLDGTLKDLKEKGVDLIHETPQTCPVGVYVALRDPSGNVMEILEFRTPTAG